MLPSIDNKGILVVIMPVYAIGLAIFACGDGWWWSSKALTQKSAKCTRDMMMEPHMTEFLVLCRLHLFGVQNVYMYLQRIDHWISP